MEQAATTVYAQGGRGNTRLLSWEGEKTLTFTVEDALLSPQGLSILSGAGLLKGENDSDTVYVHMTSKVNVNNDGAISLPIAANELATSAPVFVMGMEDNGNGFSGKTYTVTQDASDTTKLVVDSSVADEVKNKTVTVDYYIKKASKNVSELQIDAGNFAGYYYVEASTLFRDEKTGTDLPAEITLPKVKIQSNFTFSMASSGDPSKEKCLAA